MADKDGNKAGENAPKDQEAEIAALAADAVPREVAKLSGTSKAPSRPARMKPQPLPDDEDEDEEEDEDDEDEEDDDQPPVFTLAEAVGAFTQVWKFVLPYFRPYKKGVALVLIGLVIETAFNVIMPLSLKVLIDDVLEDRDEVALIWLLAVLGTAGLVTSIVSVWYEWQDAKLGSAVVADVRARLFKHVQDLPAAFFGHARTGEILSRFSVDMATAEQVLIHGVNWGALPLMELTASIVLLFVLNWPLALLAVLVLPLTLIGPRFIAPRAVRASYQLKQNEASTLALVQEQVAAQAVIKAFGLGGVTRGWFDTRNHAIAGAMRNSSFLNTMVERSVTIMVLLIHLSVLGIGAWLTFHDRISLGTFVTFEGVFWELSYNVAHVMQFIPVVIEGSAATRHMQELLDVPVPAPEPENVAILPRFASQISFQNVTYSHDGVRQHLNGLTLDIPAGRRIAVVGPSGAGKSTLLGLILRLQEPNSGTIAIDGHNIASVSMQSLRDQMAIVFQENILFHATIRENIRLGRPGASDADVEKAAKQAELHSFIRGLPDKYETMVGERGATMSGGQRQRMAIARAILRNPAILLLDEATSALDQSTEVAINKTLRKIAGGRTVLSVTHRLTSVTDMDEIIVMEAGRVVQRGTHDELLAKKGVYRRLWKDQMRDA